MADSPEHSQSDNMYSFTHCFLLFGRLFQTKCQPSAVNILDDKFPVLIIGYGKRPDYLDVSGYKPFLQFLLIVSIEVGIVSITISIGFGAIMLY
jgi:hypothetical protein